MEFGLPRKEALVKFEVRYDFSYFYIHIYEGEGRTVGLDETGTLGKDKMG